MAGLKVSSGAVHRAPKHFETASKAETGRPKVITPWKDQYMKLCLLRQESKTASSLTQDLLFKESENSCQKGDSCRVSGWVASKPLLRRGTKTERLGWTEMCQHLTVRHGNICLCLLYWERRSSTPSFRDVLHPVVCTSVLQQENETEHMKALKTKQ